MNRAKYRILKRLMPKCGYNPAVNTNMLHNQWEHQKFMWGWQSYEQYSKRSKGLT